MSNLPTVAEATQSVQYIAEKYYGPAFFDALNSYGIAPQSAAQQQQLLKLASDLEVLESQGIYKSAAVQANETENPFLSYVIDRLEGAVKPTQAQSNDTLEKLAYEQAMRDPMAKYAALTYAHVMQGGDVAENDPLS